MHIIPYQEVLFENEIQLLLQNYGLYKNKSNYNVFLHFTHEIHKVYTAREKIKTF